MAPHRFHEQFDHIQRSMPDVPLAIGPDESGEFLYERGVVLARDGEEATLVEETVRRHFTGIADVSEDRVRRAGPGTNRSGITRIRVGDPGEGGRGQDRTVGFALEALRDSESRAGRPLVTRNHVVSIAVNACPGDEPVPAPAGTGPNPAWDEGPYDPETAVRVLVVDTGLTHDHRSWPPLAHTDGEPQASETDDDGVLRQYAGHGTFIAGLVAAVAPNTAVTVGAGLGDAGAVLESEFGERLFEAVDRHGWPDVLSLSAGTSNGRTDGLLGLESFMTALRGQRTLLVAAAGNNGGTTPFWPAAYAAVPEYADAVLSVGALRSDGEAGACFSNHGDWVCVHAPGERLVSALTGFDGPVPYVYQHTTYDTCRYASGYVCTCQYPRHSGVLSADGEDAPGDPERTEFTGPAHWSGTSFATPVAAGMVASHMTAHKEGDPRAALRQLLSLNTATADVHGVQAPALRPPTWRSVPVVQPAPGS